MTGQSQQTTNPTTTIVREDAQQATSGGLQIGRPAPQPAPSPRPKG
jgi:hypothetical protein